MLNPWAADTDRDALDPFAMTPRPPRPESMAGPVAAPRGIAVGLGLAALVWVPVAAAVVWRVLHG